MSRIILASASPRRRELLTQIGIAYEVMPSNKEEIITKTVPAEIVQELATQKALDIAEKVADGAEQFSGKDGFQVNEAGSLPIGHGDSIIVIGADTIVAQGDTIMGKPADEADACRMLSMLQGKTHQVYTGVCIAVIAQGGITTTQFYESTEVQMYPMSEDDIKAYVATKEPCDKAGAYAIQGRCAAFIKGIAGDYNNVVGLPAARLYQELKAGQYV